MKIMRSLQITTKFLTLLDIFKQNNQQNKILHIKHMLQIHESIIQK